MKNALRALSLNLFINKTNSIIADGKIDRKRLAAIVFEKPDELVKLNEIVHPAIRTIS